MLIKNELELSKLKIRSCGNVFEFYEYERPAIVNNSGKKPRTNYQKTNLYPKRKNNITRSIINFKLMVQGNFIGQDVSFVTLTYSPEFQTSNYSFVQNDFKKYIKKINYSTEKNLPWIMVVEFGEKMFLHIHMLIKYNNWALLREKWKWGNVDIAKIQSTGQSLSNLSKYLTKNFYSSNLNRNSRLFSCSRSINRPTTIRGEMAEALKKNINQKKLVPLANYTYSTVYNGKTSYSRLFEK